MPAPMKSGAGSEATNASREPWAGHDISSSFEINGKGGVLLHGIEEMQEALQQEGAQITREMKANGCGR
jgi:hypothetical protein